VFELIKSTFRIKSQYRHELPRAITGNCKTLLDIGCGPNSPIRHFSNRLEYTVGVDAFKPSIKQSKAKGIHTKYVICNILEIGSVFKKKSFDFVLLSDVIEHFKKEDGENIINMAEDIARDKVVIFTTNGYVPQGEVGGNPYQRHQSGWTVEEMKERGYNVIGIGGWKYLYKEQAVFRWPAKIVSRLSKITENFVTHHPRYAYSLLCTKDRLK
jgi:predicted TPR repeat methyltransferase